MIPFFGSFRLFKTQIQSGFLVLCALMLLSGCATSPYYGGGTTWPGSDSVVSTDPNALPDIAWQTSGQRQDILQEMPQPPVAQNAPTLGSAAQATQTVKVSLLLPLSGKNAAIGSGLLKAAQMALMDVGSDKFTLIPRDTLSTPEGAVAAAKAAIQDQNALILGPLFAEDLKAIKPITTAANIPVMSFTTDWTLAGQQTYIMGFMPFSQVARIADYAQQNGRTQFAVIAPATEYGDIATQALTRASVSIVAQLRYAPAATDLKNKVGDFITQNKKVAADGTESLNFSALLLPQGGESLRSLVSLLDAQGVNSGNTKFIGTGLWDDPSLAQSPALYGAWFAAPEPTLRRDFEKRYQDNFGETAPRIATLAYDATALAAVLARSVNGINPYSPETLTNPRGFAGMDGLFRFRSDGLAERALAVIEITPGKFKVISPAATAFSSGS